MFETILVPFDGSEPSHHALKIAGNLAKTHNAKLIIGHVMFTGASLATLTDLAKHEGFHDKIKDDLAKIDVIIPMTSPASGGAIEVISDETLEKIGERLIEKAKEELKEIGATAVEGRILKGDAATELVALAKDCNADLVVTGSRGFGDVKSILLGSISHALVHDCACPCLVTK